LPETSRPRRGRWWSLLLLVAIAAGGSWWWIGRSGPERVGTAVEPLVQGLFLREITGTGVVEARQERRLSFAAGGTVAEVWVREGEEVAAGTPLARLDSSALARDITNTRASLTSADAEAERLRVQQDADRLELQVAVEQAADALAQAARGATQAELDAQLTRDLFALGATPRDTLRSAEELLQQRHRDFAQAGSHLATAEARRRNYEALAAAQLASAAAQRTQLDTQLANLEQRLTDTTLAAPFAGVITALGIRSGDAVGAQPVMTLADTRELQVRARFDEGRAGDLRSAQRATIIPDADASQRLNAAVESISPVAQRDAGAAAQVTALLFFTERADQELVRPGFTVTVRVRVRELEGALLMPLEAISEGPNGPFVVRIEPDADGGIARHVPVVVLERNPTLAAVEGDLRAGDLIAVIELDRLSDGLPVRVAPSGGRRP
jgi:HlyD family secretion protein